MFQLLAFYVILFSCRGFFEGTGGEEVPNGDKALNIRVTRGNGIVGMFTADDNMYMYADGRRIGYDNGDWTRATAYSIPKNTRVLAIYASDRMGVGGIMGALGNGIVTDELWRCTDKYHRGWEQPDHIDELWPNARSYGSNGARPWKFVAGIPHNAKWIWTNDNVYGRGARGVWCRGHLRRFGMRGMFTADDSMQLYADGAPVGLDKGGWTHATAYSYPKNTRIIAIKAVDRMFVGGILGAAGNGIVTDERWKCTHKFYHGWPSIYFDDTMWPHARSYGSNGAKPWKFVAGIPHNARWIWTNNNVYGRGARTVWCRRRLIHCFDIKPHGCRALAKQGDCNGKQNNNIVMRRDCQKTCKLCGPLPPPVYPGR